MMPKHISEQELQRMQEFAETPVYKREPEQLMPQSESGSD